MKGVKAIWAFIAMGVLTLAFGSYGAKNPLPCNDKPVGCDQLSVVDFGSIGGLFAILLVVLVAGTFVTNALVWASRISRSST
jgi:hypothetical protein